MFLLYLFVNLAVSSNGVSGPVCYCSIRFYCATACKAMHGLAVRILSLRKTCALWQNEIIIICQYTNIKRKRNLSSFITPTEITGDDCLRPEILAETDPPSSKKSWQQLAKKLNYH